MTPGTYCSRWKRCIYAPGNSTPGASWRTLGETEGLDETDFASLYQGLRLIVDPQLGLDMADVTLDRMLSSTTTDH